LKARISIAQIGREVELEMENPETFIAEVEAAFVSEESLFWVTDTKNNLVAIPLARIAFVEIETKESTVSVGFA
jgi:predicted transposase YbfD/YdcC